LACVRTATFSEEAVSAWSRAIVADKGDRTLFITAWCARKCPMTDDTDDC